MAVPSKRARRSGCPVSLSLEVLGDKWTLLVVRDLMVRGVRTFRGFLESGEGIASNILADRLVKLEQHGIIEVAEDPSDGRRQLYRLTAKGMDLAPLLLELMLWGAAHEKSGAPPNVVEKIRSNKEAFLAETRRRWSEGDDTPILPRFRN